MNTDLIDEMNAAWRRERPDLDPSPLEVIGRVLVIAAHLQRRVEAVLARHGLSLGQFDILATLRRQGPSGALTPKQLMQSVVLSSGGMTSRLDRLEEAGWIQRQPDPADRRGVIVLLTPAGRRVIDAATTDRFADAEQSLPPIRATELRSLTRWLRQWMQTLEPLHLSRGSRQLATQPGKSHNE